MSDMNDFELEDFIMDNEINWNSAGFKLSTGIMRNREAWRDWKKTRTNPDYAVYIERVAVINEKNRLYEEFKKSQY